MYPPPLRICLECGHPTGDPYCADDGAVTFLSDPPLTTPSRTPVNTMLAGRYRIGKRLGRGAFGAVHEAEHVATRQSLAVKFLVADPAQLNVNVLRRFAREARLTARLVHPNTVRVFDFGQSDSGQLYMVMERIAGQTLSDLVEGREEEGQPCGEREAIDWMVPVLRSLAEAHGHGLVHRDLKPENIMLAEVPFDDPVIKVLDFGIAHVQGSTLTEKGHTVGTPHYMSPEQARGDTLDGRSDLYAIGCLLFRLVTGRTLFLGRSAFEVARKHVHAAPDDIRLHAKSKLSAAICNVVMRALSKHPDDRPATPREFRLLLEACRDGAARISAPPAATKATAATARTRERQAVRRPTKVLPADSSAQTGAVEVKPAR